ncbi:hypothetical protein SFRURICE_006764 [Spodoptera frugiperda]|nr:hypothetical protein SFRURICE_006764 [Spodoptera frugiperda]
MKKWTIMFGAQISELITGRGVVYFTNLVESRANFRAFRRFCHTYYWKQILAYRSCTGMGGCGGLVPLKKNKKKPKAFISDKLNKNKT